MTTAETQADIPSPMPPIALTDSQLDAIVRASQPLAPVDRGKLLEAVALKTSNDVLGRGQGRLLIDDLKLFEPAQE